MSANLGQANILRKLRKYVEIQRKKRSFQKVYNINDITKLLRYLERGHCNGFGALYLFYKSEDRESIFFGNLRLISEWNETEKDLEESAVLQSIFEQWINDALWLQHWDRSVSDISQTDYTALFETVKPKDSKIALEKEFEMSFVFKEKELIETLKHVIKAGKMIRLSSPDHTISLFLKDGLYQLYDSNETFYNRKANSNELWASSIDQLIPFIKYCLFERGNKGKIFTNLPIRINIYDFSDKEKGRYEFSSSELITKFAKENNDINRKNDTDNLTAMAFAIINGDLSAIDSLVKVGISIPPFFEYKDRIDNTLVAAVLHNDLNLLKFIIDSDDRIISNGSNRSIGTAILYGYYDVAEYLAERGLNHKYDLDRIFRCHLEYIDTIGKTDPDLDVRVMKILKTMGVNLCDFNNSYSPSDSSPINYAIKTKSLSLLKYLKEQGVPLEKDQVFRILETQSHLTSRNIVDPMTEYLIKEQLKQFKIDYSNKSEINYLLLKTNPATLQLFLNTYPDIITPDLFIRKAIRNKSKIAPDVLRFLQTKMPPLELDPSDTFEDQQLQRILYVEDAADLEQACRVAEIREAQKEAEQQQNRDREKNIYKASQLIEKERDRRIAENLYNKSKENTLEPDATNKPQRP